ncbi:MAG: baseplate J/gp47 family protein [Chloroflexi bacterium]|nr:baseplate J/gp47 family protein [Chloroflexota bacterium]
MSDVEGSPESGPPDPASTPDSPAREPASPADPAAGEAAPRPERALASVVPIGRHEPIDGICGRIDAAPSLAVVLHVPSGNRAMSEELGMRRVARHVESSGRRFAIATRSGILARRARAQGVPVSSNPRHVHWGSGGRVVVRLGFATLLVPPFGRYAQYVALTLFILAVAAVLYTAGPSATVKVYPPTQTLEGVVVVRASARVDEIDLERRMVPATTISVERAILLAVPTSGEVIQGVTPATATLRLENPTESTVTVPAGAVIFSVPDFVAFEVDISVTVPAGGNAFAPVTARSPGTAGNLPADAITQWRSADLADLTVTNPEPAIGGADEPRRAVAIADVRALEALAAEIGEGSPPASLLANARPGYGIIARSATVTVVLGEASAEPGTAADVLFMEVTSTVEALAITPEVLETLARSLLADPEEPADLIPGTVLAVETGDRQIDHPDGSFTSALRLTAELPRGPSPAEIEDAVGGRSPEAAEAELGTRYGIDDVEIDLTPGWAPRLPRFGFRLDVEYGSRAFEPEAPEPDDEASTPDGP